MEVHDKIRIVSAVHLQPITLSLPHVPIDSELFPAAGTAFGSYSAAKSINFFGDGHFDLVDVSGVYANDTETRVKEDIAFSRVRVPVVRFLQCLDWLYKDEYRDKFPYKRIIAYTVEHGILAAERSPTGFVQVPVCIKSKYPAGTLCMIWADTL